MGGAVVSGSFQAQDLDLIAETLGAELAEKTLYSNAVALYRPRNTG